MADTVEFTNLQLTDIPNTNLEKLEEKINNMKQKLLHEDLIALNNFDVPDNLPILIKTLTEYINNAKIIIAGQDKIIDSLKGDVQTCHDASIALGDIVNNITKSNSDEGEVQQDEDQQDEDQSGGSQRKYYIKYT